MGQNRENTDQGGLTPNVVPICSILESIPQIQSLYIHEEPKSVSVLAVVAQKNFTVERAIYDKQLEVMDAIPDFKFNLRVISLRGRKILDIVQPVGKLVFHRE